MGWCKMNWKFWKSSEKPSLEGLEACVLVIDDKLKELEARLRTTEATAIRIQSKVYRDINAGVVYDQEQNKVAQPLTNYGPGDIIPENTQWG